MTRKIKPLLIIGFCTAILVAAAAANDAWDWYYKRGEYQGWKYIVIHHSATDAGSASAFDKYHSQQGFGGLAYHFVIGNGNGAGDGLIEKGWRWEKQITGTHVTVDSWEYNIHGIGICLVGNFENSVPTTKQWNSLVNLVAKLAMKHGIPASAIIGHGDVPFDNDPGRMQASSCPGKKFPLQKLRDAVAKKLKT